MFDYWPLERGAGQGGSRGGGRGGGTGGGGGDGRRSCRSFCHRRPFAFAHRDPLFGLRLGSDGGGAGGGHASLDKDGAEPLASDAHGGRFRRGRDLAAADVHRLADAAGFGQSNCDGDERGVGGVHGGAVGLGEVAGGGEVQIGGGGGEGNQNCLVETSLPRKSRQ